MKVIITKNFEKEYLKNLIKYFNKEKLAKDLKNKKHKFISLHFPYFKFKSKLNLVDFRWILIFISDDKIIPLILFLKKDKKYWENINWETYKQMILDEYDNTIADIEKWNYEIF